MLRPVRRAVVTQESLSTVWEFHLQHVRGDRSVEVLVRFKSYLVLFDTQNFAKNEMFRQQMVNN